MEAEHEALTGLLDGALRHCFSVTKVNDHGKSQARLIVLTPTAFYNVKKGLFQSYRVRRRILYDQIVGLVCNTEREEFVLKVDSSIPNDYHYITASYAAITQALAELKPALRVWTLRVDMRTVARTKYPERNHGLVDVVVMETDRREESKKKAEVRQLSD